PELSRNVSAILSERLLQTSRQHLNAEPEQVLVLVGAAAGLAHGLARTLARLSGRSTLLVDFLGAGAGAHAGAATFGLGDLRGGRLRPGAATPGAGLSAGVAASDAGPAAGPGGALTVVRGDAGADGAPAPDLPAALGHLGDCYHYAVVALPDGHPALTAHLLHYATRILVAGPVTALPALRARLAALPLPDGARSNLRLLLTEAPAAVRPTVATLELFEEELGAPVRAIVPADGERAPEAVAALARWLAGQRVGLALGAGGAKGYAHLGALRALRAAGVPFDCVTGVSIGAIVGAAVATGATAGWIEAAFEAGASRVVRPTLPVFGMLSNRALRDWLRGDEMYGRRLLEDLPIPFAVSAADLTEGREIVVRRGPIWRAVLASAAIPGMYPPVRLGRHWLVDGGVVNPVPVSTAQALGADVVIAVDLSEPLAARQEPGPGRPATLRPPWLATNMLRARDIMMSEIRAHTLGEPSVVVKPQVEGVKLHNFEQGKRFVEAGQAAAEAVLPHLRKQLPWLN
ncbi:MAG TPA: patatin-like phospholipase family protein, partial [Vicinamibacteria bacterium]